MTLHGAAHCSLETADWQRCVHGVERAALTDQLGCSDTAVDAYRIDGDTSYPLPDGPEQVCLVLDGRIRIGGDEPLVVPRDGVGCVPAGVEAAVQARDDATVVAVATTPEPRPGAAVQVVGVDRDDFEVPSTSDVATAHLTGALGCRGVKCNARRLEPGQRVPYHTEGDQEELFVPVRGPAAMEIDGVRVETPPGTVVRVAPPVPRSALNDGEVEALWVMFGAPPTGGPTDWDPGATILDRIGNE